MKKSYERYLWENIPDNKHDTDCTEYNSGRIASHNRKVITIAESIENSDYEKLVSHLTVTTHSKKDKLSEIFSISTLVTLNKFCLARVKNPELVCSHCFAAKISDFRKDLKRSLARNTMILTSKVIPAEYWSSKKSTIAKYIRKYNIERFRFESFGDTENEIQAANYCNICKAFPNVLFTIWSKNFVIWEKYFNENGKPENLIYIHSSYRINTPDTFMENKWYVDYIFTVYERSYAVAHHIDMNCCNGIEKRFCKNCKHCYNKGNCKYINETLR